MKEIYIFGTGASRAISNTIPLGCELGWGRWSAPIVGMYKTDNDRMTTESEKIEKKREGKVYSEFQEVVLKYYSERENIKKYFPYPKNDPNPRYKELKDCIPDLDYLISHQTDPPPYMKNSQGEYYDYSSKVIFDELTFDKLLADQEIKNDANAIRVIKQIIHEHLTLAMQNCAGIRDKYNSYKTFKKKLAKKDPADITLVSLNYDYLLNDWDSEISLGVDYKMDFDDVNSEVRKYKKNAKSTFTLLKPHGSLDWQICMKCKKLYLQYPWLGWDDFNKTKCPVKECDGLLQSFIFMPHVDYPNANDENTGRIKPIMSMLERSLQEAERIIVIGYSLPDYDKHMIKHLNGEHLKNLRKFKVVDFEKDKNMWPEKEKEIRQRWTACNIKIDEVFLGGFQEWVV